jgi:hypothetical protein
MALMTRYLERWICIEISEMLRRPPFDARSSNCSSRDRVEIGRRAAANETNTRSQARSLRIGRRRPEERVRELERLLGHKTREIEILKEALDLARIKTDLAVAVAACGGYPREEDRRDPRGSPIQFDRASSWQAPEARSSMFGAVAAACRSAKSGGSRRRRGRFLSPCCRINRSIGCSPHSGAFGKHVPHPPGAMDSIAAQEARAHLCAQLLVAPRTTLPPARSPVCFAMKANFISISSRSKPRLF